MGKIEKHFKKSLFVVIFLMIAAVSLLLSLKVPFIYTVNDDLFMKNILSGAYLGRPDAHVVYMEYPLCAVLMVLYRISAKIPWYGICFFLFHVVSWTAVVYRIGMRVLPKAGTAQGGKTENRVVRILPALGAFLLGMLLYASSGFYHVASMQFTVTAAVLGMAGLVWFMTADLSQDVKPYLLDQLVTAVFVFLSFNVRRNVLFMLIPIAGMLWLKKALECRKQCKVQQNIANQTDKEITQKRKAGKAHAAKLLGMAAMSAAGVAAAFLSYGIAYGDAGWQDYILYNDNATVLYDYYEWPDYAENKDLYDELGISEEAYVGARDSYLLSMDSSIDSAAMVRLAERSNSLHQDSGSFFGRCLHAFDEIVNRTFSDTDRPLNLIVVSLYGLVIFGALVYQKYDALLTLAALFIGRMFAWMYVVYEGRYPMRISQSLFLAEAAVLAVILCHEILGERAGAGWEPDAAEKPEQSERADRTSERRSAGSADNRKWRMRLTVTIAALYFLFLSAFAYVRLKHVFVENTWRLAESQDLRDLKNYCEENREYFYFVDTKSITNDTESIFDTAGGRFEHYIVFGGWLSNSPAFLNKLELAGVSDAEKAIMDGRARIIVENEERCPVDYLENYFASKYEGMGLKEVDRFGRDGDQFSVYMVGK